MKIRKAELFYVENIMKLAFAHFEAVNMKERGYSFDYDKTTRSVQGFISNPAISFFVGEENDVLCAMIAFVETFAFTDSKNLEWVSILWYGTTPTHAVKMFMFLEDKFPEYNNIKICIPVKDEVKTFLEKKGFKPTEVFMSRIIKEE